MKSLKDIANLLFPQRSICLFCRENTSHNLNHICPNCMDLVELVNRRIDLPIPYLERVYYSLLYNRFVREKLHAFKFRGTSYLYKPFGELLVYSIHSLGLKGEIDAIAFVPLHRRKLATRGYNQCQLLARFVAESLKLPLLDRHLLKVKWTKDQNQLDKMERMNNLKDAFRAVGEEDIRDKKILLIDDIITTGTTMRECSKALMEKGASSVYGLALTSSMKV
ncbi:MAG: ComF family protein [Tissierellia bacterium]|nr:ComF family protein [Tissierellia bacterium]